MANLITANHKCYFVLSFCILFCRFVLVKRVFCCKSCRFVLSFCRFASKAKEESDVALSYSF